MKTSDKNVITVVLVLVLLICITIGILTLLGPTVGNVHSDVIMKLESAEPGGGGYSTTATPFVAMLPTPSPPGTQVAEQQSEPGVPAAQQRLIIKNGDIVLVVENTEVAVDQVTQIAADNGGYVLNTRIYLVGDVKAATMTIAVESANFETAMQRLGRIALEVIQESSSGEDVTAEYIDLQSRLKNLETTRDRLREFLAEAANTEEALNVNRELSVIEEEIEIVVGRMNYLSGRAAFSTITVEIEQFVDATPTPTPTLTPTPAPWSLGPTIKSASQAQVRTVQDLLEALTWIVIVPGPYLLVLGLIGYGVWRFRQRLQIGQVYEAHQTEIDAEEEI